MRLKTTVWQKVVSAIAVFVVAFVLLCGSALPAAAADYESGITDANKRQLVIVVRFAGDSTGDNNDGLNRPFSTTVEADAAKYRTQWEWTLRNLNAQGQDSTQMQSVYSYVKTVSEGRCRLESVSPQTDVGTGKVAYLTLPASIKSYSGGHADTLVLDAVRAFCQAYPSFDWTSVDKDANGYVDNVLVVPEVGDGKIDGVAIGSDSSLWSRQGSLGNPTDVGSIKISNYTIVNTGHTSYVGTLSHETLHVFGAKDLYRSSSGASGQTQRPVGLWDIMAEPGTTHLMWPLAITRQNCGWVTLQQGAVGSHTLYASGSGKQQALIFKSPLNSSEYFVAEFRKASTKLGDLYALDYSDGTLHTLGGSGLIVYRVNPAAEANGGGGNKGAKDYVYVFRAGETDAIGVRGDGAGGIKNAQLSSTGRKTLGLADLSKGLTDGAVTFSDGQNSGLVYTVTGQTADSITFTVSAPQEGAAGVWSSVTNPDGSVPFPLLSQPKAAVTTDGASLYAALANEPVSGQDSSTAYVWKYDGTKWTALGGQISGASAPSLCWHAGSLYLATQEAGSLTVRKFNGSSWAVVGSVPSVSNVVDTSLASINGVLYALTAPSENTLQVYEVKSGLQKFSSSIASSRPANCMIVNGQGKVVLVASEGSSATSLYLFSGSSWTRTKVFSQSSSILSAVSFKGEIYVYSYAYQSACLAKLNANGTLLATSKIANCSSAGMGGALTAGEKNLYLTYLEGANTRPAYCYTVDTSSLALSSALGTRIYSGAGGLRAVAAGSKIYCALPEQSVGGMVVRSYSMPDGDKAAPAPSASSNGASGTSGTSSGDQQSVPVGAWRKDAKGWWYEYKSGGYPRSCWQTIDGVRYYFNGAGYMATGWLYLGNAWYYLQSSGALATGWQRIGGVWYYLDPSTGVMKTGWLELDSTWYFLRSSGAMATGWLNIGGTWYYLQSSGAMATGWVKVGGSWYYLTSSGAMATGWQSINGTWYYLYGSGAMASNRWVGNYYVTSSGAMAKSAWIGRYHVNDSGLWDATR